MERRAPGPQTDDYLQDYEPIPDEDPAEQTSPDELAFWQTKQRDLVTSTVDYNLGTLSDLVESGAIDLSPGYQRRFRWDAARQSRLIESFLMNVPVPPVFLNEDEYGKYSVIDGKQRITAINDFLEGRLALTGLKIFSDINNATITKLPSTLQSVLRTRPTIRTVIVLRQSDPDIKFEVFQRLNTGGVKLNPQEIRNSAYPGPLNDAILDMSVESSFHHSLGIRNREKSALYKEMRDAEFVLRFLTFRNTWAAFRGGMAREMDRFMSTNQRLAHGDLAEMRKDFFATLAVVSAAFGDHAFHRWQPEKDQWRRHVLASLFDAQMFACRDLKAEEVQPHTAAILVGMKALFGDQEFRRAVDAATNTPKYFQDRVRMTRNMILEKVGRQD